MAASFSPTGQVCWGLSILSASKQRLQLFKWVEGQKIIERDGLLKHEWAFVLWCDRADLTLEMLCKIKTAQIIGKCSKNSDQCFFLQRRSAVVVCIAETATWTRLRLHVAMFDRSGRLSPVTCKATDLPFKCVQPTGSLRCSQPHNYFPKLCCLMLHSLSSSVLSHLSVVLLMDR